MSAASFEIDLACILQINFGDIFSVLIIRFGKFIYHKVISFIILDRLHIRLPHPF